MKIELFEIDPETHMVAMNKTWIGTIKEFKTILKRDRGSEGDMDGRVKLQAEKEFTFIYHFCDFKSKFREYSEEDKLKECLRNANLSDTIDIYSDAALMLAIERYKKFQETATLKLLNEAKEGFHTAYKVVRKIRIALEARLDVMEFNDIIEVEEEEGKKKKATVDPVLSITNKLTALMQITDKIATSLDTINSLEEKVKKELGEDNVVRGGLEKGVREDKPFKNKYTEQPNPLATDN